MGHIPQLGLMDGLIRNNSNHITLNVFGRNYPFPRLNFLITHFDIWLKENSMLKEIFSPTYPHFYPCHLVYLDIEKSTHFSNSDMVYTPNDVSFSESG